MQDQQLRHSRLQRKGGSLIEPGNAVQFAEVCFVLSDCLIFRRYVMDQAVARRRGMSGVRTGEG
jgi:hypothetical protein